LTPLWQRIREVLAHCDFGPPASESEILRAEQALAMTMPEWLRETYRHFDGISGDINTPYLFPISDKNGLIDWNQFLRNEWKLMLPQWKESAPGVDWKSLDVSRLLIIGNHGLGYGNEWAVDLNHGSRVVRFDCSNFDEQPVIGETIVDVYQKHLEFLAECERDRKQNKE
jgi:SMI1 / KNR4 family (SUKH-1)